MKTLRWCAAVGVVCWLACASGPCHAWSFLAPRPAAAGTVCATNCPARTAADATLRIAYSKASNVYIMDGASKPLYTVTTRCAGYAGSHYVAYPWYAWSPDGKYLLVVRETGYPISWDLLLMDARGNLLRTLASGLQEAYSYPSWALDADEIAYLGVVGAAGEVVLRRSWCRC